MNCKLQLCGLAIALLMVSSVLGQRLALDTAVKQGTLANGFTYYIRHNAEPKNRVFFSLAVKAGSLQEKDNQRGLAHFLEHMNFNGTKHYPKNKLVTYLQKSGVRFGADLNAYTSFDETVYQLPMPSDDPDLLQHGLQIMRDWAHGATLATEDIDKERGVILEEKRMRNNADTRLMEQYFPLQVNGSLYKDRMPIGTNEVLEGFKPGELRDFYVNWYRPNLQALIVVGDIDVAAMEKKVKTMFGDLKNPGRQLTREEGKIMLTGNNQFLTLTDAEQQTTRIDVLIKLQGLKLRTEAEYRETLLRTLVNSIMGERMRELSQQPEIPFVNARVVAGPFMGGLDAFQLTVTAKSNMAQQAFTTVWTEVQRLKQKGITESELERGKKQLLHMYQQALAEKNKTSSESFVREYTEHFLREAAAPGIEAEVVLAEKIIPSFSAAEVLSYLQRIIKDSDRDILILAPDKEKPALPAQENIYAIVSRIANTNLPAYSDRLNSGDLLSTIPAPVKAVSKETLPEIGVTKLQFANGATAWLKPTQFKNDQLLLNIFSVGGSSLYPDTCFINALNAGHLVPAFGAGNYSTIDLGKLLTGKTVRLQPFINDNYEGIQGMTTPKDVETALQLMYLYFTAPRADTALLSNIISRSRDVLASRSSDPRNVLTDSTVAILGGYHYRRMPPRVAQLDSISMAGLLRIFSERFSGAGDFHFVFTGSMDTSAIITLLETYVGSLPAGKNKDQFTDLGIHIPYGKEEHTIYRGKEDKAEVRLVYSGDYTFSDENNIQMSALGSVLNYRMLERIREAEGGAYTPQAGVNLSKYPRGRYAFNIVFTCAPTNVEKLIAAAREEIAKLRAQGPPADDIKKFTAEETRSWETGLENNEFWNGYLGYVIQHNEDPAGILKLPQRLRTVTTKSIQTTATKYLDGKNFIRIVMLPEKLKVES